MNNQQMMRFASLQHRVARIEKEAALQRLKEKVRAMLSNFGQRTEKALLYMPEQDIKKAMAELKRNPEFMEAIGKVPPRSSFQKVKEFLTHYFRKELKIKDWMLGVAVVVGTLSYFLPMFGIPLILLALGGAILDDPGVERERTQDRAVYHARNRILNERKASQKLEADHRWVEQRRNLFILEHQRLGVVGSVELKGGRWAAYDEIGERPLYRTPSFSKAQEALLDHLDISDSDVQ